MTTSRLALTLSALLAVLPLFQVKGQDPQSTLEVLKLTHPFPRADLFQFTLEGPGGDQSFDLQDGESEVFDLDPGVYTITETVPEDWTLGLIRCGLIFELGPVASGAIRLELDPGESVICRFENDRVGAPPAPPPGATEIPVLSPQGLSILLMILAAAGGFLLRRSF